MFALYLIAFLPVLFLVYCFGAIFWEDVYYRYKACRAKAHKQLAPVYTKYNFPLGIPWIVGLAKAGKKNKINEQLQADIVDSGRLTIRNEVITQFLFMTSDPENMKAILATQFEDFNLGDRYKQMLPLLGDGIFTLDGGGWHHSRTLLRPQFSREQISHVVALEGHVKSLISRLVTAYKHTKENQENKDLASTQPIFLDLQELFHMLSMDSATEFFFGESVKLLSGGNSNMPDATKFGEAFDIAQEGLMKRAQAQKLYYLVNSKKFRDACKTCRDMTEYYVKSAIQRVEIKAANASEKEQEPNPNEPYVFMDELAKITTDVNILRDQALNLLIAGRDTVASLLSWLFFSLATNPEVFERLRQQVLEEFGTDTSKITFSSLKRCRYLQYTINETLRLYPTVPSNVRTAVKDTTLPRGGGPDESSPIFIPKGANVLYHVYGMHRNKDIWGPDADIFRPERWGEPNAGRLNNHPWAYLPFNGGPRICLGQQYALTETSYVVVRFLQHFKGIVAAPELLDGESKEELQLTLTLQKGLPLMFIPDDGIDFDQEKA